MKQFGFRAHLTLSTEIPLPYPTNNNTNIKRIKAETLRTEWTHAVNYEDHETSDRCDLSKWKPATLN